MKEPVGERLAKQIEERSARIGIIGLGYVGLPLSRVLCRAGYTVIGFDIDAERVEVLSRGENPLEHLPFDDLPRLVESEAFLATTDFKKLRRTDVAIICVPTPLNAARDPDLSHVRHAAHQIRQYMNGGMLVVLESTTYPGTTEEVVRPILEESGLDCGRDFFLAFSPEREDPGNRDYETATIPKVVGGIDEPSGALARLLYGSVIDEVIQVSDAKTAEAAKILENIYRSVNIALVNELKVLFDRMDIDIWEVIQAASSKPFGYQAFYPGPGLGGHCIPIDPFYLAWRAREYGMPTRFIELAGEINTVMPDFVVGKVADALNEAGRAVNGSEILILGVAYKKDVGDIRESPALSLITQLTGKGAHVRYHDPHVPMLRRTERYGHPMESVPLEAATLQNADLVLIVANHSCIDYQLVGREAAIIVDTRNAMAAVSGVQARVVLA